MSIQYEFKVPMRDPVNRKKTMFPRGAIVDLRDVEMLSSFAEAFDIDNIRPTQAPATHHVPSSGKVEWELV